jgi:hypothetical protein
MLLLDNSRVRRMRCPCFSAGTGVSCVYTPWVQADSLLFNCDKAADQLRRLAFELHFALGFRLGDEWLDAGSEDQVRLVFDTIVTFPLFHA